MEGKVHERDESVVNDSIRYICIISKSYDVSVKSTIF